MKKVLLHIFWDIAFILNLVSFAISCAPLYKMTETDTLSALQWFGIFFPAFMIWLSLTQIISIRLEEAQGEKL